MAENDRNLPGRIWPDETFVGRQFEPGTVLHYQIHLPTEGAGGHDLALYVLLEHGTAEMIPILSALMQEGVIPVGMTLFVNSGVLPPTLPGGSARNMRAEEFDQFGREFSDMLVEELIPEAAETAGVTISASPDMHFITGGSSGGICAWNAVWFRNDYFRRAFLSSPTFSAMRGGEEPMVLLRKTETRPIRVYVTVGTVEPDYFFGSSFYAACNARAALEFAGYDFRFELFSGEHHCCRRSEPALWRRMMTFVWNNWRTESVRAAGNQIRINRLLEPGSLWEEQSAPMPAPPPVCAVGGEYSCDAHTIRFQANGISKIAAEGFDHISGLALSGDGWRLYVSDLGRRFVFALSVMPDGSLTQRYKLAPLHLAHDCRRIGASGIAVTAADRIFAATELGVQGIISFGMVDLILPLPGDRPADHVAVEDGFLYASSGTHIYRRRIRSAEVDPEHRIAPATPGYSDGFDYSRNNLPQ